MRLHRSNLGTRLMGTMFGVAFILVGFYAVFAPGEAAPEFAAERSAAFGVMAVIVGVAAIFGSWVEKNVDKIWCAHPRPWWRRRL